MKPAVFGHSLKVFVLAVVCWFFAFSSLSADPLEISTASLPNGVELEPYSVQLEATGGRKPYQWILPGTVVGWGSNGYRQITIPDPVREVVEIDAGSYHSLALKSDGTVWDWGLHSYGDTAMPDGLNDVISIAAGGYFNLALKSDGTVVGWGGNNHGQITIPAGLSDVVAIAAGSWHSLALKSDGTVIGWGKNSDGQTSIPAGLSDVVAISAGYGHSVALKSDGTLVAWGSDWAGQATVPVGLTDVVAIDSGSYHNLALKSDGSVVTWGSTAHGLDTIPAGLNNVLAIDCGGFHNLALKSDGTVVSWGDNGYSQTTLPESLENVVSIAAGLRHSLVLQGTELPESLLISPGGLLQGTAPHYNTPELRIFVRDAAGHRVVKSFSLTVDPNPNARPEFNSVLPIDGNWTGVTGMPHDFSVSASDPEGQPISYSWTLNGTPVGTDENSLTVTDEAWVFGSNKVRVAVSDDLWTDQVFQEWEVTLQFPPLHITTSDLSNGMEFIPYTMQMEATGGVDPYMWYFPGKAISYGYGGYGQTNDPSDLSDVTAVSAGYYFSLALKSDGTVVGWGMNTDGQVTIPEGLEDVISIAAGGYHSLALKSDGTVVGWGRNTDGQTTIPAGLKDVVMIAAGYSHSLALTSDGVVWAWGLDAYGQATVPSGLNDVISLSGGLQHTLALQSDGTVLAWGANHYEESSVPDGLQDVVAIQAGYRHSLALKSDGSVVAWGDNNYGQTHVPTGLNNVVSIAASNSHSLALKSDGTVVGWGRINLNYESLSPADVKNIVMISAGDTHSLFLQKSELPEGLEMNLDGRIQGVTPLGGTYDLNILVRDSVGYPVSKPFSLVIDPNPNTRPVITSCLPAGGNVTLYKGNEQETFSVTASDPEGGSLSYVWMLNGAPVGTDSNSITLDEDDWFLGVNTLRVLVSDGLWTEQVYKEWSITLSYPPLQITTSDLPNGVELVPYSFQLQATGGVGPYRWVMPGNVVAWGEDHVEFDPPEGLSQVVALAGGYDHSVALKSDGTVVAWGKNTFGQTDVPVGLADVVAVTAGKYCNLAVKSDGTVVGWGYNSSFLNQIPEGLDQVVSVSISNSHALALKRDGTVVAWGSSSSGQTNIPHGLRDVVAVVACGSSSLALKEDGTVIAWGSSSSHQTSIPDGLSGVVSIVGGNRHVLALKSDGTVVGWGMNTYGQPIYLPDGLSDVVLIDTRGYHCLALKADGSLIGWDTRVEGLETIPTGLNHVFAIAAGEEHSLVLQGTGLSEGVTMTPTGLVQVLTSQHQTLYLEFLVRDVFGSRTSKILPLTFDPHPNTRPHISSFLPATNHLSGLVDDQHTFSVIATDPEGQPISYAWTLNGNPVGTDSPTLTLSEGDWVPRENRVRVTVSDDLWTDQVFLEWTLDLFLWAPLEITTPSLPEGMEMVPYSVQLEATGGVEPFQWGVPGTLTGWGSNEDGETTIPVGLNNVLAVAAGLNHSLALKSDGSVVAWGKDDDALNLVPEGLESVVSIAAGDNHSLALKSDGTVVAWGNNEQSQTTLPEGLSDVVAITAGVSYSLALKNDGTVVGWGYSGHGLTTPPERVRDVVAISAGSFHNLALKSDGTVVSWGNDFAGSTTIPEGLQDVIAISAGYFNSFALKSDGTVVAWGHNAAIPSGLQDVVAISSSKNHHLALKSDGSVVEWSTNPYAKKTVPEGLGNVIAVAAGPYHSIVLEGQELPKGLSLSSRGLLHGLPSLAETVDLEFAVRDVAGNWASKQLAVSIAPNANTTPIIDSSLPVESHLSLFSDSQQTFSIVASDPEGQPLTYFWSLNGNLVGTNDPTLSLSEGNWSLGENRVRVMVTDGLWTDQVFQEWTVTVSLPPLQITTTTLPNGMELVPYFVQLEASGGVEPYRWTLPGNVVGFGADDYGQTTIPGGLDDVVSVATGDYHCLALKSDGTVVGWGYNAQGQATVPTGLTNVVQIACGEYHSLALKSDGMVVGWGTYPYGLTSVPEGVKDVVSIAAGSEHSMVLRSDGTVVVWGSNSHDQLAIPEDMKNVVSIAAGGDHSLALLMDGTVVAWGKDFSGQSTVPDGLSDVVAIAAGYTHSLALKSDGTVVGWGNNYNGQTAVPAGLSDVVTISAGVRHSIALKSDGSLVGWGSNYNNQTSFSAGLGNVVAIAAGDRHTILLQKPELREGLTMTMGGLIHGLTDVSGTSNLEVWVQDVAGHFTSKLLSLTVDPNLNTRPVIESFLPAEVDQVDYLNDEQTFSVKATDPEGHALTYSWTLNGSPVGADQPSVTVGEGDWILGENTLRVTISDDLWTDQVFHEWTLDLSFRPLELTTTSLAAAMEMVPYSTQLEAIKGVKPYRWILPGIVEGWGLNDSGQTVIPSGLTDVVSIAAGEDFCLALKLDGTVVGWGRNSSGQITIPSGLTDVVSIAASDTHSLAVKSDGTVVAWGSNAHGKATVPLGLSDVAAIAAGSSISLALKANGTVVGWGYEAWDRLPAPDGLKGIVSIDVGYYHCLALKSDGTVVAWGGDYDGQATVPVGLSDVIAISAGRDHSLALKSDGTVVAWGKNTYGQATVPAGLTDVVGVAAGAFHNLALKSDGTVVGWGRNLHGQIWTPDSIKDVVAIAAGGGHSVVLRGTDLPDGLSMTPRGLIQGTPTLSGSYDVEFWVQDFVGNRVSKLLNLAVNPNPNTRPDIISFIPSQTSLTGRMDEQRTFSVTASDPEPLSYAWSLNGAPVGTNSDTLTLDEGDWVWGENIVRVAVSDDLWINHVFQEWRVTAEAIPFQITTSSLPDGMEMVLYALQLEAAGGVQPIRWILPGNVVAWGSPSYGQTTVPVGLSEVVSISAGESHSLALKADGTVEGWGRNSNGQVTIPEGLSHIISVAAGGSHSLALQDDGTVVGWGNNWAGQATVPPEVKDVVAISGGWDHSLALTSSGTVVSWGNNSYGQSTVPAGLGNVVAISAGYDHNLALRSDGTVVGWGRDSSGESTVPAGLSDVVAIAAGDDFSLALKEDGTVVGWGNNAYGRASSPSGLTDVVSISAGRRHSLALKSDGSVVSWGSTSFAKTLPEGVNDAVLIAAGGSHNLLLRGSALPEGLTMTPDGLIQGRSFHSGTFHPEVQAYDFLGNRISKSLTLTVDPNPNTRPEIVSYTPNESNMEGLIDDQRSFAVVAQDPEAQPLSFSWSLNGAPVGTDSDTLTLGDGDWIFGKNVIRVTISDGLWEVQVFHEWILDMRFHPLDISTMALPDGTEGVPYSMQLEATGGVEPYRWLLPGTVMGWGRYNYGQTDIPVGTSDVVALSAGYYHNLALKSDGTVIAWGRNTYGETDIPEGLTDVVAVAAGGSHSLALKSDGTVVGWGYSFFGQTNIPSGLNDVVAIAAGANHSLALKSDGTVIGWGRNSFGETLIPEGLSGVVSIAAGGSQSMALKADGTVIGWGRTWRIPSEVSDVVSIAVGHDHSLALKRDRTVVGWGNSLDGQTTIPEGLTDVVAVSAGIHHSLALKSDGSVVGWGRDSYHQASIPSDANNGLLISAGGYHNLILQGSGLPEGIVLKPMGILEGLPAQSSTTLLNMYVRDLLGSVVSQELTLTIQPNLPPVITAFTPSSSSQEVPENSSRVFSVTAQDPESQPMTYVWRLNGSQVGADQNSCTFSTLWGGAGAYTLSVVVMDGISGNEANQVWSIIVLDDNDGDGVKNTDEVFAGSDPSNPESNIKFKGMQLAEGTNKMDIHFSTVAGRSYLLQTSSTLVGPWVAVGTTLVADGSLMVIRTNAPDTDSPVFYRLLILDEE